MSRKNLTLIILLFGAVTGLYFYAYKDSFRKANIQISYTIRPRTAALLRRPANASDDDAINTITFRLAESYRLTSVKVVPVPELATNKYAHPVWELITDSNSVPIQAFSYGMRIRGMQPSVKGARPDPLIPNVPYRLFVQAGALKGEHDFTITADNHLIQ